MSEKKELEKQETAVAETSGFALTENLQTIKNALSGE